MNKEYSIFDKFSKQWALVTAGSINYFNSMTIGWGEMGTIWGKSVITIYVRPERYTHSFLEENDYFTISFYDEKYLEALRIMGTKSGRDVDKAKLSNLTPFEVDKGIVTYKEASETYICRKIYSQDLKKEYFPKEALKFYGEDGLPHTMYIGEIIRKIN